ncbi:MAG: YraN family protein [Pirellulales bacterium]
MAQAVDARATRRAGGRGVLGTLGYRVVHRNYAILGGELDIVAVDGRTVVFVEVKTFGHSGYDRPEERVDAAKRRQLTRVANAYRKRYRVQGSRARFDVIGIVWPTDAKRPDIKHIRNAFDAEW